MRLDLREVRLNRDAECEKHKCAEELKVYDVMEKAEGAGGKVSEDLLVNEHDSVDAETFGEETSDANREDADKERDEGKKENGECRGEAQPGKQVVKIAVVGDREEIPRQVFLEWCLHGPSRH